MEVLEIVLYIVAIVLLLLAAFNVGLPRIALGWIGLAVFVFTIGLLPALE